MSDDCKVDLVPGNCSSFTIPETVASSVDSLRDITMSRAGSVRPVPSRSLLVRDIQLLATLDTDLGDIRDAAVYAEGNIIKWVGASVDLPKNISADETISLPNRVLIPGLVNTHHHMFQCLTRCVAQVCEAPVLSVAQRCFMLINVHCAGREALYLVGNLLWSLAVYDCKPALFCPFDIRAVCLVALNFAFLVQGKDVHISSKLAMVELIMSGCTCSSDHLYIYPNDVQLQDSIRAAR